MLAIVLSYMAFIILLRDDPSIPTFFRTFIMKIFWVFSKAFLHLLSWLCDYGYNSIYMLYNIYWFVYVEPSLTIWNETNLIMVYNFLNVLLNSVCKEFIEYSVGLFSFLLLWAYVVLVLGWYWPYRMRFEVLLPFVVYGLVWGVDFC
jgi:hypothetical protein